MINKINPLLVDVKEAQKIPLRGYIKFTNELCHSCDLYYNMPIRGITFKPDKPYPVNDMP